MWEILPMAGGNTITAFIVNWKYLNAKWEYLVHYIAQGSPYMVVKGFFIIKVDMLLVFLFYFSNFIGFPGHKVQVLHHYKRDTLHLRWVQKHT